MTATNWNVDPARIDRNWRAITIELDAPRPGRIERVLRALGIPAHLTRVMVATPGLRRAWFVATGLAMLIGVSAAEGGTRESLFSLLLIAPMVPVLGVAFSYGVEADPAHEAGLATPMRGLRLLLSRTAMILVVSTVLLTVATVLAPATSAIAFAWLLPSLGLTSATVALMSWLSPRRAAAITAIIWVVGVTIVRGAATDRLAAFGTAGQSIMLAVTIVAGVVLWLRRERFDVVPVIA